MYMHVYSLFFSPLGKSLGFIRPKERLRLPWLLSGKESAFKAGDVGDLVLIPGLGRSPGGGNGNPLQYSCLEKSMGQAVVHGIAKSWTRLCDYFHFQR